MDHKEQHHQHHQKEREHHIEKAKAHEHHAEEEPRTLHPLWFVVLGVFLISLIVLSWTFFL